MKKPWLLIVGIILAAIVGAGVVLILPLGQDRQVWALYVFASLLHIGVAALYLTGLKGFKYEFKIGYWFLASAMALYAIGVLELPLFSSVAIASEGGNLAGQYYLAVVPFIASVALYYIGTRRLANILAIKTILLSPVFIVVVGAVVGALVGIVTFYTTDSVSGGLSLAIPFSVLGATLTLVAATCGILWKLKRKSSALYAPAFAWSFYGFLVLFVAQIVDPSPFLPEDHWYLPISLAVPFLLSVFCFMKGAYEFNRIHLAEGQLANSQNRPSTLSSVDIVLSIAQLVSNPSFVDPELDKLRSITSKLKEGGQLSNDQQTQLADLYKYLEDYLVQKEPTRHYTNQGLRQLVEVSFKGSVNEPAFWQRFSSFS